MQAYKMLALGVIALAVSACATTPNDVAKLPPAYVGHTSKSVQDFSGCVSPKIGNLWPFTQSLPINGGLRIVGQASMSIPKAMLVIDVVGAGDGSNVTYIPKSPHIPKENEQAVKSCI